MTTRHQEIKNTLNKLYAESARATSPAQINELEKKIAYLEGALSIILYAVCEDCGKYAADYPSKLCPGCEAYQAHTR
jgi:hypothetical protein